MHSTCLPLVPLTSVSPANFTFLSRSLDYLSGHVLGISFEFFKQRACLNGTTYPSSFLSQELPCTCNAEAEVVQGFVKQR